MPWPKGIDDRRRGAAARVKMRNSIIGEIKRYGAVNPKIFYRVYNFRLTRGYHMSYIHMREQCEALTRSRHLVKLKPTSQTSIYVLRGTLPTAAQLAQALDPGMYRAIELCDKIGQPFTYRDRDRFFWREDKIQLAKILNAMKAVGAIHKTSQGWRLGPVPDPFE
jgi:hypothetical protein